ncbi:MAG: hypothetical protein V1847_02565 [Candidatus Diapherotrites archaeon]
MDEALLLETVQKMLSSGISEEVIRSTLKELGVSDAETNSAISKAKRAPSPATRTSDAPLHEQIADRAVEKIQKHLDEKADLSSIADSSTEIALQSHGEKLEDVQSSVSELHEKIDALPGSEESAESLNALEERVKQVQKDLKELKAQSAATQELLKKVLQALR